MNGRAFLEPARDLIGHATEAHRRSAAGRAYYAAFQEARATLERWGLVVPPRENIHAAVRLRFSYASHPDLRSVGIWLEDLVRLRNEADYRLASPGRFHDEREAKIAIVKASALIDLLDAIEADPIRRAEAIATLRS